MLTATDARGEVIHLSRHPRRIVSLVPSATETLCDLGLQESVVGVTRFCVHPMPWVKDIPKVGGTKDVDPDKVRALSPDLIVANCEENTRELFSELEDLPLFAGFPRTVRGAIDELRALATLTGTDAEPWCAQAEQLLASKPDVPPIRVAYLIWRNPWMTVAGGTYISDLLLQGGFQNVFADEQDRFPTLSLDDLRDAAPERVLLSSEPFPFAEKHRAELAEGLGWDLDRFAFIDGETCSWHGTRVVEGLRLVREQHHQWQKADRI